MDFNSLRIHGSPTPNAVWNKANRYDELKAALAAVCDAYDGSASQMQFAVLKARELLEKITG